MLDWFRRFWKSEQPKTSQQSSPHLPPVNEPEPTPEPVLSRGKTWMNTGKEAPADSPKPVRKKISPLQLLIQQLSHNETAERQIAAKRLESMGSEASDAVPALVQAAVDVEASVRDLAVKALRKVHPDWGLHPNVSEAVPRLTQELGSRFQPVRHAAIHLLCQLRPRPIAELVEVLSSRDKDVRQMNAAVTLGRIGSEAAAAVPALATELNHLQQQNKDSHVRQAIADALCDIGVGLGSVVPVLVVSLADWNPLVRQSAARALARADQVTDHAIHPLVQLLTDRDADVRNSAVEALVHLEPDRLIPELLELLQILDVRELELWIESKIHALDWSATQTLTLEEGGIVTVPHSRDSPIWEELNREPLKALRNLSWCFHHAVEDAQRLEIARESALRILGKIGPAAAPAVPALIEALLGGNRKSRIVAAHSLGQIGTGARDGIPALLAVLSEPGEPLRKAARQSLDEIDSDWVSDAAAQELIETLAAKLEQSEALAKPAMETLVTIGSPAVPSLMKMLAAESRVPREAAAKALGEIGPNAQEAIPALQVALEDSHGWVRKAAEEALKKIQST